MSKNLNELLVIILLISVIVIVHTTPLIAKLFENNPTKQLQLKSNVNLTQINIKNCEKIGRKYYKVFDSESVVNIYDQLSNSEIEETCENNKRNFGHSSRMGSSVKLLTNNNLRENLENIIKFENDHLVYFVKVENGHRVETGQLMMLHNLNGILKEAKSIWYIFIDINWKFENKWIIRDHNTNMWYVPENNTIIEFDKNCKYNWSELKSETPKFLIVIYNF